MGWLFGESPLSLFIIFIAKAAISAVIAAAAWNKGRSFMIWFLYSFLLPYLAVIHVFLIASDEDGILYRRHMAICPECARPVDPDSTKCPVCRSDLTDKYLYVPSPPSEKWIIALIVTDIIMRVFLAFVSTETLAAAGISPDGAGSVIGSMYNTTMHNFGETLELFGMPHTTAAAIAEKLSVFR